MNDPVTYTPRDFLVRTGIVKPLLEEYLPLLRLAASQRCVRSVALSPESHPGHDGMIRFWCHSAWRVRIVCGHEDYNRALMRERMTYPAVVSPENVHYRDKSTGRVLADEQGAVLIDDLVRSRVERIVRAVELKEARYRDGTDTLLVHEEGTAWDSERAALHPAVCAALTSTRESPYQRIFVAYGDDVRLIERGLTSASS